MNAVRSVVLAAALAAGSEARAADGDSAVSAALLGPAGLIQVVPVAPVVGGGAPVDLYLVALNPDGSPMTGLSLKATRTLGLDTRWTEVGGGVYRIPFTPPEVAEPSMVSITARGKSPATKLKVSASAPVQIMPDKPLTAGNGQVTLTLGRDTEVVLPVTGSSGAGVVARASAGTVTLLPDGQARYEAPKLNYPHVAVLTFADAADPLARNAHLSLQLNGSVEYPLKASPGASVSLVIGDRTFGPVLAGADGKAKIPVEVPPGVQQATQVTSTNGQETREQIDLKIPETRRLELVPLPAVLPADPALVVPVRVAVRSPTGGDETETPVFTPSAGTVGPVVSVGGGLWQAEWRLPSDGAEASIDVSLGTDLQKDTITVGLVQRRPTKVELAPSVTEIGPDTEQIDVVAKLTDASGAVLIGADLVLAPSGADPIGDVLDLGNGDYRFALVPGETGPTEVRVWTRTPPSKNPVGAVVVVPDVPVVANDGAAKVDLRVAAVDAQGVPVAGATVMVDLTQGDGTVSSSQLTTDDDGMAETSYIAGKTAGLVGIRASSAGSTGFGTLLQVPVGVASVVVPVSGTARDAAVVKAWTSSFATITIPRSGEPVVAGSPWTAPEVAKTPEPVTSHIRLTSDVPIATPGATITVTALFVPPPEPPSDPTVVVPPVVVPASTATADGATPVADSVVPPPPPMVPELVVTGATMGAPTIGPDGMVTVTLTVAADATEAIEVTAKAAGLLETLSIPLEGANPWAGGPAGAPVVASDVPRSPPSSSDRRWFRGRVSGLLSTYQYEQSPSTEPGPLLPSRLAVGGSDGGSAATPIGGELDLRAWGDAIDVPYVGVHGQVRLASYGIQASAFNGIARDLLTNVDVDLLGRYPFEAGGDQYWVGLKAGFRYNDFLLFTGCLDPGCTVSFEPVTLAGFGGGAEIGADIQDLFLVAGATGSMTTSGLPYAYGVDVDAGYEFVDRMFVDLGFSVLTRTVVLQGSDSGIERGAISDSQVMGKLGIGFAL